MWYYIKWELCNRNKGNSKKNKKWVNIKSEQIITFEAFLAYKYKINFFWSFLSFYCKALKWWKIVIFLKLFFRFHLKFTKVAYIKKFFVTINFRTITLLYYNKNNLSSISFIMNFSNTFFWIPKVLKRILRIPKC